MEAIEVDLTPLKQAWIEQDNAMKELAKKSLDSYHKAFMKKIEYFERSKRLIVGTGAIKDKEEDLSTHVARSLLTKLSAGNKLSKSDILGVLYDLGIISKNAFISGTFGLNGDESHKDTPLKLLWFEKSILDKLYKADENIDAAKILSDDIDLGGNYHFIGLFLKLGLIDPEQYEIYKAKIYVSLEKTLERTVSRRLTDKINSNIVQKIISK